MLLKEFAKRWGQEAANSGLPGLMAVVRILQFYIIALEHTEKLPTPIPLKVDGMTIANGMVAPEAVGGWLGRAFKDLFGLVFPCSDGFTQRFTAETGLVYGPGLAQIEDLEEHLASEKGRSSDLRGQLKSAQTTLAVMTRNFQKERTTQQKEVARLKAQIKDLEW